MCSYFPAHYNLLYKLCITVNHYNITRKLPIAIKHSLRPFLPAILRRISRVFRWCNGDSYVICIIDRWVKCFVIWTTCTYSIRDRSRICRGLQPVIYYSFKRRYFCMLRNTRSKLMKLIFWYVSQAANKLKKYV
jgi:hypothetical protein